MKRTSVIKFVFASTIAVSLSGCGVETETEQSNLIKIFSSKESHTRLNHLNEQAKLRELKPEELIEVNKIQNEVRQRLSLKSAFEFGRD